MPVDIPADHRNFAAVHTAVDSTAAASRTVVDSTAVAFHVAVHCFVAEHCIAVDCTADNIEDHNLADSIVVE